MMMSLRQSPMDQQQQYGQRPISTSLLRKDDMGAGSAYPAQQPISSDNDKFEALNRRLSQVLPPQGVQDKERAVTGKKSNGAKMPDYIGGIAS